MLSKIGMLDQLKELKQECKMTHHTISIYKQCDLWEIYKSCITNAEFKERAKKYLGWYEII